MIYSFASLSRLHEFEWSGAVKGDSSINKQFHNALVKLQQKSS